MTTESHPQTSPPQFFTNFWQLLIEIAKSIDREGIREKVAGAYHFLLNFITRQFLKQQDASELNKMNLSSACGQDLMQFAKKYHWNLEFDNRTSHSSQMVVTPAVLDLVLQEYVNYTQGVLPDDLDQVKTLPFQAGSPKARGKKFSGSFFTPPRLARFLAQRVIANYLAMESRQSASTIAILDPSMGSGIFLVESAGVLLQQFTRDFPHKSAIELIEEILNTHVFGMDILSEAVQTTQARLTLWAAAQVPPADLPSLLGGIDFKQHILCIDALTVSVETLFRDFGRKSFPVIVGNPPFLHTRTGLMEDGYKKQLKVLFADVARGQWDLCTLFTRRVGAFIDPRGHWGLVLPIRLLSNEHYEPIRRWVIENFQIRSLVDAGMAFPDAGVEVFLLVAGPLTKQVESFTYERFDGIESQKVGQMQLAELRHFPFSSIPWLPQEEVRNLVLKISDQPRCLGDLVTITRGFECGFNDPSIGTQDQLMQRGYLRANLIPAIKGTNIHPFSIVQDTPPIFCSPDWDHPEKYKTSDLFANVPKIVIRFVANDVVAAIDEIGYVNTNGLYNLHTRPPLQPADLWWILTLLNSVPVSFWFKCVFSNRDKLYPHIQKNQLDTIPIPLLTDRKQQILTHFSKTQQHNTTTKKDTIIQDQLLTAFCITLYLKDELLEPLLDELGKFFLHNNVPSDNSSYDKIQSMVAILKNRYIALFESV